MIIRKGYVPGSHFASIDALDYCVSVSGRLRRIRDKSSNLWFFDGLVYREGQQSRLLRLTSYAYISMDIPHIILEQFIACSSPWIACCNGVAGRD